MSGKEYNHYYLLTPKDLILMIEKKDQEINILKKSLKNLQISNEKIQSYNQFHMEEITRLDKVIGKYKLSKKI